MVIEFDTYRYYGHSVADSKHKGGYRKKEEIEKYMGEHDPIQIFKRRLIDGKASENINGATTSWRDQLDAHDRNVIANYKRIGQVF